MPPQMLEEAQSIGIGNEPRRNPSERVQRLWANKTMLIINEISMVGSEFLHSIENRCKVMKNLDPNSTARFGGPQVVIALGDFPQFSPMKAKSLWQHQTSPAEKHPGNHSLRIKPRSIDSERLRSTDQQTPPSDQLPANRKLCMISSPKSLSLPGTPYPVDAIYEGFQRAF
jgi:hypothetical protein